MKMTYVLLNRGPDDGGYFFDKPAFADIGLGHRRLSIHDISNNGHQPISFEYLTMVYNGEVYNFKEIRKELESLRYNFFSQSDSEVILKSFH
jgi:asparagine synthase (glutamine-hydrolysing)